jgi:hypothetical protein
VWREGKIPTVDLRMLKSEHVKRIHNIIISNHKCVNAKGLLKSLHMHRRLLLSGHDSSSTALLSELLYLMLECSPGAGNRVYALYNRVSPKRKYVRRLIQERDVIRLIQNICRGTTHTASACYLSRFLSTLVSVNC